MDTRSDMGREAEGGNRVEENRRTKGTEEERAKRRDGRLKAATRLAGKHNVIGDTRGRLLDGSFEGPFPGTSCQTTIVLSLGDAAGRHSATASSYVRPLVTAPAALTTISHGP
jgi:hypothetical protein